MTENNIENLLIKASQKLIDLQSIVDWKKELLSQAPPVLWFGNSKSAKPKILTVGANPSRWEFLDKTRNNKSKYLLTPRFCHLSKKHTYEDILNSKQLRDNIISSFNDYFEQNPYHWFGCNKEKPYNAEGVLRGMKASYYNNPKGFQSEYQACHIDIFPFATISDFTKIQRVTERDILCDNWAKSLVDDLISYFNPEKILVFGKTNFNYFSKYFEIDGKVTKKKSCIVWNKMYNKYHLIGISTNLGNPRGFNSTDLFELGRELDKLLKEK